MAEIRKCANCEAPEMMPVSREMQIYHSVYRYKCQSCGEDLEMVPLAGVGIEMTVGALALGFWGMILFHGAGSPGWLALGLLSGASLLYAFLAFSKLVTYWRYPVVASATVAAELTHLPTKHIGDRLMAGLEKLGFLAGLLAPLLFIGVILGIAFLIGYVNFTYFE
ncbi:hypothetical protein FEE96_07000 [Parasedimentitalea maritima]|uniref:DUF983 domain-containing protein n=1 Tax=Parasedimentitalea maritima TaxID=2578117 RepID=A0ABY2UXR2_9RHOB|nr:hypothetical protein [Zongyanglinia marina]TLP67088.1 hypothetical protein FEE96_07000 [Zongyanglinia marina]